MRDSPATRCIRTRKGLKPQIEVSEGVMNRRQNFDSIFFLFFFFFFFCFFVFVFFFFFFFCFFFFVWLAYFSAAPIEFGKGGSPN